MNYIVIENKDYLSLDYSVLESSPSSIGNYKILKFKDKIPSSLSDYKVLDKEQLIEIKSRISSSGLVQEKKVLQDGPFKSKAVDGYKLFNRTHGIKEEVSQGENNLFFSVPYLKCKITAVEILWGEEGDTCDLIVLDSESGDYTGVPSFKLNQFAFNVCVSKGFYKEQSEYDADLFQGMQLKLVYNSSSAKTIGINFKLHELV